jgi:hypothetical protein
MGIVEKVHVHNLNMPSIDHFVIYFRLKRSRVRMLFVMANRFLILADRARGDGEE